MNVEEDKGVDEKNLYIELSVLDENQFNETERVEEKDERGQKEYEYFNYVI